MKSSVPPGRQTLKCYGSSPIGFVILRAMDTLARVKSILGATLNLGDRADRLTAATPLLGGLPEFDSMAVVTVVTMIEDEFGIEIADDDLSAEVFATVGTLAEFVLQRAPI